MDELEYLVNLGRNENEIEELNESLDKTVDVARVKELFKKSVGSTWSDSGFTSI